MTKQARETVIVGGNGKTGSRVAQRLLDRNLPMRIASRSTAVPFDWDREDTWQNAIAGADTLYLTYYPDLAIPGAAEQIERLCSLAKRCEIQRIVLLAGRGEPQVHRAEEAVRNSGLDFTILECAFFNQNFSEGALAPMKGTVTFPAGDVAEPFVDCEDIADVVVAALTEKGHSGNTYELTGPRALTFAEATRSMASASGVPLEYNQVSFEQYGTLLQEQMPPAHATFLLELFQFLLDGHNTPTTSDVERVLGRPARSFEDYAHGAAKAWRR